MGPGRRTAAPGSPVQARTAESGGMGGVGGGGPGHSRDLGDVVGEGRVDAVGTQVPERRRRMDATHVCVGEGYAGRVWDPALHGGLGSPAPLSSISGVAVDIWLSHLSRKVYCNQCEESSSPLPRAGPCAGSFKAVRQRARPISCLDS